MATIAPVVMSIVIWIVTQSVFALLFAALGPIVAVGSFADSRLGARRKARRECQRFERELDAAYVRLAEFHAEEIAELDARYPCPSRVIESGARWAAVSKGGPILTVVLGRGRMESDVQIDSSATYGAALVEGPLARTVQGAEKLRRAASTLDNAPLSLELRVPDTAASAHPHSASVVAGSTSEGGHGATRSSAGRTVVGIIGVGAVATSVARSLLVQLAAMLPPEQFFLQIQGLGPGWGWLGQLPHSLRSGGGDSASDSHSSDSHSGDGHSADGRPGQSTPSSISFVGGVDSQSVGSSLSIVVADGVEQLPADCEVILDVHGSLSGRIVQHPDPRRCGPVMWQTVTETQAGSWAASIAAIAMLEGRTKSVSSLPLRVDFAHLNGQSQAPTGDHATATETATATATTLVCTFAVDERGPVQVDLVNDGPHAIVGGTTGSGKSELLIAWVLALATRYSPSEVSVLLVDFKGGSSFGNLIDLPHSVGLITDLDESTARRALESLAAEITFRERTLRAAGARSIGEFPERHRLPRLVIVVDEFAAMASEYPDLHALFSDIAARGRSLGVHLILCTQRPAGVIKEAVFANSGLRISLRVNNKTDSTAVIDSDAAARLPAHVRGRAILSRFGDELRAIQCALTVADDVEPIVAQFANWPRPRRPWLDQLPNSIPLDEVWKRLANTSGAVIHDVVSDVVSDDVADETVVAVPFGVLDAPDRQEQPVAFWQPARDGHLLVVGQSRSGKSVCAQTIHSSAIRSGSFADVSSPISAAAVWDTVCSALTSIRSGHGAKSTLVILDDLDAVLSQLSEEHQADLADRLVQVLREGPAQGAYFAITVQRVTSVLHQAAVLFGSKLILSLATRQDHVMAGGVPNLFTERSNRGAGSWCGERVQVALADDSVTSVPLHVEQFSPEGSFAVVSTAPQASAARVLTWMEQRGATFEIIELASGTSAMGASALGLPSTRGSHVTVSNGEIPRVMIGDPESWQSHWGALGQARSVAPVIIDGCSAAEFRTLTRERTLPPPLVAGANQFWLLMPNREAVRAQFTANDARG